MFNPIPGPGASPTPVSAPIGSKTPLPQEGPKPNKTEPAEVKPGDSFEYNTLFPITDKPSNLVDPNTKPKPADPNTSDLNHSKDYLRGDPQPSYTKELPPLREPETQAQYDARKRERAESQKAFDAKFKGDPIAYLSMTGGNNSDRLFSVRPRELPLDEFGVEKPSEGSGDSGDAKGAENPPKP